MQKECKRSAKAKPCKIDAKEMQKLISAKCRTNANARTWKGIAEQTQKLRNAKHMQNKC